MELNKVKELLKANIFRFAKTMADKPHYYTVKKTWKSSKEFEDVVLFIKRYGYKEKYGKYTYTYINIDGFKYWAMPGYDTPELIIINRVVTDNNKPIEIKVEDNSIKKGFQL